MKIYVYLFIYIYWTINKFKISVRRATNGILLWYHSYIYIVIKKYRENKIYKEKKIIIIIINLERIHSNKKKIYRKLGNWKIWIYSFSFFFLKVISCVIMCEWWWWWWVWNNQDVWSIYRIYLIDILKSSMANVKNL